MINTNIGTFESFRDLLLCMKQNDISEITMVAGDLRAELKHEEDFYEFSTVITQKQCEQERGLW